MFKLIGCNSINRIHVLIYDRLHVNIFFKLKWVHHRDTPFSVKRKSWKSIRKYRGYSVTLYTKKSTVQLRISSFLKLFNNSAD